ncbi:MAG: hypothetical protein EU541_04730 [Promethearchaeota archaeon]|nr:MAG: hypothetical protein EU541_04730 [Candidatus Lokiarchaeota archaeon]
MSKLVGKWGTIQIPSRNLEKLIEFSIEPDQIHKQKIVENLFENLSVSFEWLINHTVRAKKMAIQSIKIAYKERQQGSIAWVQHLGWAFHFITDWATPHHSPSSKSNPIPAMVGFGALFGGILGGLSTSSKKEKKERKNYFKEIIKGSLIGAGVMGTAGTVKLSKNHNKFEDICDERWQTLTFDTISPIFKEKKINLNLSQDWNTQLSEFQKLMKDLRNYANNLPSDWIDTCDQKEFIEYMIKIAIVMDFAAQMIMK